MGMDVFGHKPTTEEGKYFRASIWGWPSIITVMEASGYDVPSVWSFNDGEGLSTQESCDQLADMMDGYLSEQKLTYAPVCTEFGAKISNKITQKFKDTDITTDIPDKVDPKEVKLVDNEFVQSFITFLRGCGGFRIC